MNEMKLLAQEMQGFLFVLPPKALKWRFLFNKVKRARNVKSPRNFFTGFLILELSRAKSPGIFYPGKKKILEFFLKISFKFLGKKWNSGKFLVPEFSSLQCSVWKFSAPGFYFLWKFWHSSDSALNKSSKVWCELSNAEQKEDKIFKGLNRRASSGVVGGRYGIGKLLPPFYIHKFSLCFSGLESYTHIRMVWSTFHEDGGVWLVF